MNPAAKTTTARHILLHAALGCLTAAGLTGCNDSSKTTSGGGGSVAGGSTVHATSLDKFDQMRSDLDQRYVLGPTAADSFGYRVSWNIDPVAKRDSGPKIAVLEGDSLFVVDEANYLSRILRATGTRSWSWPVGDVTDTVLGVNRGTALGRDVILVTTEGDVHLFDSSNGVQLDRHPLSRVAATSPVLFGPALIYGSIGGQLVWHHFESNSYIGGYTLHGGIRVPPVISGDLVVGVSDQGHVIVLDARTRVQLWSRMAREAIVVPPAVGPTAIFVASLDQYIRCYDLGTGEVVWSALHAEPLREAPILIGDRLFLHTEDKGLCCYEAIPVADLDGNLIWNNPAIHGTVIGRHRGALMTWNSRNRVLTLLDETSGTELKSVNLPKVRHLVVSDFENGELFAVGDSGSITKAVPRQ